MEWDSLYQKHASGLLLYARQWFRSQPEAEEVVQDGFVRLWRPWEAGRIEAERVESALYANVRYAALDRLRGGRRRRVREERAAEDLYDGGGVWFESTVVDDERNCVIPSALEALPDAQREVLVMKVWGGLKFREIAEALEIPMNTAAARYRYGLAALRKRLPNLMADDAGVAR